MNKIFLTLLLIVSISSAFADSLPQCRDASGKVLSGSVGELKQIMASKANKPQAYAVGVVSYILPDDTNGLPHQKFYIEVNNQVELKIVSNLDFGRIPLEVGQKIAVCGEFLNVDSGMIHWTHFDPRGTHANGFTILNGELYGSTEVSGQ